MYICIYICICIYVYIYACIYILVHVNMSSYFNILLVVSHDRDFLDSICTNEVHLKKKKIAPILEAAPIFATSTRRCSGYANVCIVWGGYVQ